MSLVVRGVDLGNPLAAAVALRDVARTGGNYPELYALLSLDDSEEFTPPVAVKQEAQAVARSQARRALADHGHRMKPETRLLLERLAR